MGNFSSTPYTSPVAAAGSDQSLVAGRAGWGLSALCCPAVILFLRHQPLAALWEHQHTAKTQVTHFMLICKLILLSWLCSCPGSELVLTVRASRAYLDSDGGEGRAQDRQAAGTSTFPPALSSEYYLEALLLSTLCMEIWIYWSQGCKHSVPEVARKWWTQKEKQVT